MVPPYVVNCHIRHATESLMCMPRLYLRFYRTCGTWKCWLVMFAVLLVASMSTSSLLLHYSLP